MQIKAAIVIAAVTGAALSAPTSKSECTPMYEGELKYEASFAGGRGGDESGVVVHKDGKLQVKLQTENKPHEEHGTSDVKHGTAVKFEKCSKVDDPRGNVMGRIVLKKGNKCIVPDGEAALRVDECSKKAEFLVAREEEEGYLLVMAENRKLFNRGKDDELGLVPTGGVLSSSLEIWGGN